MEGSRDHIIVSLLVSALLDKLSSSEALREFGSDWSVQTALGKLSEVLKKIEKLFNFAEEAQIRNIVVKECLRHLREVAYHAQDILDEFIYEANKAHKEKDLGRKVRFEHFPSNLKEIGGLLRRQEIEPLINDELIKKLVEIEKELKDHYLRDSGNWKSHGITDEIDTRPKSGSLLDMSYTLGRNKEQDKIKKRLLSSPDDANQEKVSVIAIVGLGGVGKTILVQLVYNDPDVKKDFERRAWVCVSTDFNVVRLISAILESLTGEDHNLSNLEPLQRKLREELRGKRVLIVLDDVWTEKENDWKALRVAFMGAGEGSRIIMTTRSRRVSSMMHPIYTHDIQILSDEECWSIMERRMSMDYSSIAPNLEEVGRKIAKKCKGLPLAASTLAGLLCSSSSSDLNHWEEVLNSSMWDLLEKSNLPAALCLSYYFLPTYLKQCFAYCSLFPEDYKFRKQRLIQLWIAEGFVRSNTTRMEDKGSQYFDDLLHRSFFQHDHEFDSIFVMHDLVHDLAEVVSGETCYRSICCTKHMIDLDKIPGHHNRLSTFFLLDTCFEQIEPIEFSFGALRYLRVLDLEGSYILKLANDIGDLKYLHYINLTSTTNLGRLPESLCDLHSLQSLIPRDSGIRELPRGMKYLRNLQHLDLDGCPILSMPQGIGKLTNLKALPYFPVSKNDDGRGIRELKELSQLEGTLHIHIPGNVIDPRDAQDADLMNKTKVDRIEFDWSEGGDKDVEVLESLRPHSELKGLRISKYVGSTFPRWLMIELPSYKKLDFLTLKHCTGCRVLPPIGELPLLESLYLEGMEKLEEWSSSEGQGTEFQSLLDLSIHNCPKLRILPHQLLSSPRLRELRLECCPVLGHARLSKLTSLKNLGVGRKMEELVQFLEETDETLPPNINRLYIENFKSLPKGLRNLSSLRHLEFGGDYETHYSPEELPTNVIVTKNC